MWEALTKTQARNIFYGHLSDSAELLLPVVRSTAMPFWNRV